MTVVLSGEYRFMPVDRVVFGPGSVARLPELVDRLGSTRTLLATTRSVAADPTLLDRIQSLLGPRLVGVYRDARQFALVGGVASLREEIVGRRADLVVSLGGGSAIDTVKAAISSLAQTTSTFLPHVALPTTLSAAEFSPSFGMTDEGTRRKSGSSSPSLTPKVVVLDAELTRGTPDWLWLGSGIRALDHAVETVYAPDHQPATDVLALAAIRVLFAHLPASTGDGALGPRQECQVAAWLSFFGVDNITLGLSHVLGRELGPRYGIPHGHTSAILLPHVLASLLPSTAERQRLIAVATGRGTEPEDASRAVGELVGRLGLPRRLRDVGVPESDLTTLAGERPHALEVLRSAW